MRISERVPKIPVISREHLHQLEKFQEVLPYRRDEAHFPEASPGYVEVLHSCTTGKEEGHSGSWLGREWGPQERKSGGGLSHRHRHHQDRQNKASVRPHSRTTRWAKVQVSQTGVLVRLWSTGNSASEGRAEGTVISGTVQDAPGAAHACPGPSR